MEAKVIGVCLSQRRTDPKKNIGSGLLKKGVGLVGDAHSGTEKEVSLLPIERVQKLYSEKGILAEPGSFAENITTEGIDLKNISIGTRLRVGHALLEVIQIGKDPSQAHTYNFHGYSLLPTDGIFCKVIESGEVKVGDPILILKK